MRSLDSRATDSSARSRPLSRSRGAADLLSKFCRLLGQCLSAVAGVLLVALMILTVADVSSRYLLNDSISGVVEVTEVALVGIAFLGALGAQVNGRHVVTPVVTNRLPSTFAHLVRIGALLAAVVFLAWVTFETSQVALDSFERGETRYGVLHVPIWPARACVAIGLGGLALGLLAQALTIVEMLRRKEAAPDTLVDANL